METTKAKLAILSAALSMTALSACEEDIISENEIPSGSEVIADSTMLAYYPLDGDTKDYSGYGHHATPVEEAYSTGISGEGNTAYHIASKSGALDIPDFAQEQISVSLWYFYAGTESFWNTLLYGKDSHHHLIISHANGAGEAGELGVYTPGFSATGYKVAENQWHHLVVTKDGDATKIYLNGVAVYDAIDFSNTEFPLTVIGNFSANNGTQGSLGKLDEIKIYNKILTQDQVVALSAGIELGDPQEVGQEESEELTGLIAYYPLNGNTNDASGFSNDGTAYGGSYGSDRFGTPDAAFVISEKSDAIDISDFNQENISVSMWYQYDGTGSFWNTLLYGQDSHHHLIISHANGSGSAGEIGTYAPGFQGSNTVLDTGTWYHVVLVKEGSQSKLYINNSLVQTVEDFSNADFPLTVIGNFAATGGTQGALGKLDEIKIYERALTASEVAYLYEN